MATTAPPKPAGWTKPNKQYGGFFPPMKEGGEPDLSTICSAVVQQVQDRRQRIQTPGYCMKVRESCPLPCCQYLLQSEAGQQQKIIIKKTIRRRRPPNQQQKPEQAPSADQQQQHQQAAAAAAARQWQEAEARRQQEMQQEAERQRQAQEEELRRQQQQREEEERQQQAAAAAAAAAAQQPAAPVQKVATFQNLGTDPTMAQAELYYESTRWGPLGHGDPPVSVGTFPGHRWFIVANGVYAKLFTVGEDAQQVFTI